jgi:4-aminobutyrate aminotransferase-like enzyme
MTIRRDDPCGPGRFVPPVRSIQRRTELPGPQSRAILARHAAVSGHGADHTFALPMVIAHAHGARVTDVDNNVFLDFSGGGLGAEIGYTQEEAISAAQSQLEVTDGLPAHGAICAVQVQLAELLATLAPPLNGPTATLLFGQLQSARRFLRTIDANWHVYRPLQPSLASSLDQSARLHLSDETEIGLGRTGRFFAAEHLVSTGLTMPDALLYGGRELPLVALTLRTDLLTPAVRNRAGRLPDLSPLACVRALEALRIMQDERLVARAVQIATIIRDRISTWAQQYSVVERIESEGALLAVRCRTRRNAKRLIAAGMEAGVLLRRLPYAPEVIPLCYALMTPEEQLYEGLSAIEEALEALNDTD